MTHPSILGMNWTVGQRQLILDAQLKGILVVKTSTPTLKSAPVLDPIEEFESKIHNERLFIVKYKCNYRRLASEAYGRIKYYRRRIAELKAANEPIN